ncbi:MAG: hypothetical protein Q9174_003041 [Haloplaca sp. 1 TL-2023]
MLDRAAYHSYAAFDVASPIFERWQKQIAALNSNDDQFKKDIGLLQEAKDMAKLSFIERGTVWGVLSNTKEGTLICEHDEPMTGPSPALKEMCASRQGADQEEWFAKYFGDDKGDKNGKATTAKRT